MCLVHDWPLFNKLISIGKTNSDCSGSSTEAGGVKAVAKGG